VLAAGFTVPRGPLLGGASALICRGFRVRRVVRLHCVDEGGGTRRSGPDGGHGWRRRRDRWSRAQRQGRWRRQTPPATVRREGVSQPASVRPHFLKLGRALPHPVPQVATEGAGPPPPGRGRRLRRTAPSPAARCARPASREPKRMVRVGRHGTRARTDRVTRRHGAAPAAPPGTDGVQLRASTRGLHE